jgi:hypothetical protein
MPVDWGLLGHQGRQPDRGGIFSFSLGLTVVIVAKKKPHPGMDAVLWG